MSRRGEFREVEPGIYMSGRRPAYAEMGFKSIQAYRKSQVWKTIRDNLLAARPVCRVCGDPATEIHHKSYGAAVLKGQKRHLLVPICRFCHRRIHFTKNNRKRTLNQANQMLAKLQRRGGVSRRRKRAMCSFCGVNRTWFGGPCPPCRKARGIPPPTEAGVRELLPGKGGNG